MTITDSDTRIDQLMIEGLQRMSGAERLQRAFELTQLTCAFALADIRQRHPAADERECLLRLASRRTDPEILRSLVGWDVDVEGY